MDIYKDRIRPIFDKSGLTDKEIEKELSLPRGVIYKWGTGKYKSYKTYIPQIANYFHVSTDYLLGNTDDPSPSGHEKPPEAVREPDINQAKIALFGGDSEVTDEMWEEALFAAKLIKERYRRKKDL